MTNYVKSTKVLILLLVFLTGCSPYTKDKNEFAELVSSWGLVGNTVQNATTVLEGKGFQVSRIRSGNNPSKPELFPEALFATLEHSSFGACGGREWRIALTIEKEIIASEQTYIIAHCL